MVPAFGGLTSEEAARRLAEHGPNEIQREPQTPAWRVLARQFNSAVIWLLVGACVVSVALGEVADAVAIASIVALNSVVGFLQEHRAERAILALRVDDGSAGARAAGRTVDHRGSRGDRPRRRSPARSRRHRGRGRPPARRASAVDQRSDADGRESARRQIG